MSSFRQPGAAAPGRSLLGRSLLGRSLLGCSLLGHLLPEQACGWAGLVGGWAGR